MSASVTLAPIFAPSKRRAVQAKPQATAPVAVPVPVPILSTRPSRAASRHINYAEASDESLGGTSGNGRKRRASPAAPRVAPRPKALLRLFGKEAESKARGRKASDSDEEEAEEEDSDQEEIKAPSKSKITKALDFSTAKKQQQIGGASAKYVRRFVIACEEICSRDAPLLSAFHTGMQKLLPLNPANLGGINIAMEKVFDRVFTKAGGDGVKMVERIHKQLRALGPDGFPTDKSVLKAARDPLMSKCSLCQQHSFLTTICTHCKKFGKGNLQLLPFLDWRKVVLKQRALDAAAEGKAKKDQSSSDSDGPDASPRSDSPSPPPAALASPNKRARTVSASPSSSVKILPLNAPQSALEDMPQPDAAWIDNAREQITLRAIQWLRVCMAKCSKEDFAFYGGDIIFLLRNAIFKGQGEVSKQARETVSEMIRRWDASTCTIISDNSEPAHVMVFAECLHAKQEMQWCKEDELADLVRRLRSAVSSHCAEDLLRFDCSRFVDTLPTNMYCPPSGCGSFQKASQKDGKCPVCLTTLRAEEDYDYLTESLVWLSLFRELGIDPMRTADATVRLENMLALIKVQRPYKSLVERGWDSFRLQCYYLTHLMFVLTKWGACALKNRALFVEEYLFMVSAMDVMVCMEDPELVGELLQALHILDTPHSHPAMQKGYHFLLGREKAGKMRGNWVPSTAPFYQKYHAAYCGIIGLAEFVFTPNESFPPEFEKYFR